MGVSNLEFALKMNACLNRMGTDSVGSGEVIGWAIQCIEKGLLSREDFDFLDLRWGNTGTIEKLLMMVATRQGIGNAFAQGTKSLAKMFGKGTERYAFHGKGLDMMCDNSSEAPYFELTRRYERAKKKFGAKEPANQLSEKRKAATVDYTRKFDLADRLSHHVQKYRAFYGHFGH